MASDEHEAWERNWRFKVGTFSPSFWSEVVQLQLTRLEAGAHAHRERVDHPERRSVWDGFGASMTHDLGLVNADAYFLLMAIERVLRIARVYEEELPDRYVQEAIAEFTREAPDVKDLRDVLTHLDEYGRGAGRRRDLGAQGSWWPSVGLDFERDEFTLPVGKLRVELKRAARAAIKLARTLNELRAPAPGETT